MIKITRIERQKNNKERYSIYINEEYGFSVHEDILVRYTLAKGMELEKEFIDEVLRKEEQSQANNYALRLLSYKMRTEKEIWNRMIEKEYPREVIEATIDYLKELKYIDDEEYTRKFIKDKVNLKNIGKERIKRELFNKGIDSKTVNIELEELVDDEEQYDKAMEIAVKKLNTTYKNDDKNARYRKLGGFLQRRGYSMDIVMRILREIL
ncbi:regulatory protein RecX [Gottschalkia acidurici 9a]|uniref:Regulatory protein RecX n=1 Tax=Gottschalkia acidurici (strain ATCC 7906 / DSM 604 / BCRC 14475 / CIP 104303 / KCTC 5404 / NCIMB 10678 / 9a) TaxID=1128398 RepID=K0AYA9_GOTA9|nr:RecX family transcriptional regulator [Gottschalkia acidurici]AFS78768.1 regulatory protein RecX [Gottschalkia acidurici 9a]